MGAILLATSSLLHCSSFGEADLVSRDDGSTAGHAEAGSPDGSPGNPPLDAALATACEGFALRDDFERANVTGGPWASGATSNGGSSLAIDTGNLAPDGGSRNLRVRLGTEEGTSIALEQELSARSRVRLSYLARLPAGSGRALAINSIDAIDLHLVLYLYVETDGKTSLREQRVDGASEPYDDFPLPALDGAWHAFSITLDATTRPTRARVDIDGKQELDVALRMPFATTKFAVHAGVGFASAGASKDVRLDNVAVCSEP